MDLFFRDNSLAENGNGFCGHIHNGGAFTALESACIQDQVCGLNQSPGKRAYKAAAGLAGNIGAGPCDRTLYLLDQGSGYGVPRDPDTNFSGVGRKKGGYMVGCLKYQGQAAGPESVHEDFGLGRDCFDKGFQVFFVLYQNKNRVVFWPLFNIKNFLDSFGVQGIGCNPIKTLGRKDHYPLVEDDLSGFNDMFMHGVIQIKVFFCVHLDQSFLFRQKLWPFY